MSNSSRIALFIYSLDGGGAERVMANLAISFAQQGFKVDLVLAKAQGPYLSLIPPEVRIVDLKASGTPASLPHLIRYLRREKPAALLSAMHYGNEVALWAKILSGVSTRLIVSEHNALSKYARHTSRKIERWTPLWAKLFYPWADGIVAVSHGVAQDLVQVTGLSPERVRVIYNPVVTPELTKMAKEPVDHPWFAPQAPPVILGVGRLVEQKDFPTLIRAFAQVRQVRPARLMILGKNAGCLPALEALVSELGLEGDVALPGFVNNPYAYLARSAVFTLSSRQEGFGNAIAEALAVGTPVVSTDCESGPAEILDNGKYGELVPVGDSKALAEGILSVLSGKSKSVESAWLDQFKLPAVTQNYLDVLGVA